MRQVIDPCILLYMFLSLVMNDKTNLTTNALIWKTGDTCLSNSLMMLNFFIFLPACVDKNTNCKIYKKLNYCGNQKFKPWLQLYCGLSCGFCTAAPTAGKIISFNSFRPLLIWIERTLEQYSMLFRNNWFMLKEIELHGNYSELFHSAEDVTCSGFAIQFNRNLHIAISFTLNN